MKMFTTRVINGRLDVPEGAVAEGAVVTVLVPDEDDEGFTLSEAEETELLAAIAACERGEFVDGWQLLRELKR
ncbi:MAG: hypothetical protein ACRDKJ_09395 [Actinomycetota bacterium]